MVTKSTNSNTSGFEGVEIRPNGSVRISFNYQGRCRETIIGLGTSKKDLRFAHNLRCEIINKIATNTFNYSDFFPDSSRAKMLGFQSGDVLMGTLFDDYLVDIQDTVATSTYTGYRKAINVLRKAFGSKQVRHISPKLIKEWVLTQDTTPKTIKNRITPLNAVLNIALNDGLIKENPLKRLDVAQLLKKKNPSNFEVDPFSIAEINKILGVANDVERNLFQFAFFSGLRTSELIGLKWSDVDIGTKEVHVCRAVTDGKEKGTKTKGSTRTIPLLPPALEALKSQRALTGFQKARVFLHPKSKCAFSNDKQVREGLWRPLLKRAEVRYRNPYQTRHTFASTLLSAGENIWMVASFMGHTDTNMIVKHYGKWIPQDNSNQYKNDYSHLLDETG